MKNGLKKIVRRVIPPFNFADIILLIGTGSVFYGAFLIYQPAAYLLLGAGLIYMAIRMERAHVDNSKAPRN